MASPSHTADIPGPGEVVAGKYVVESRLSAGGMGVVLKARHPALGQHVALKILRAEWVAVPAAVARFAREARSAAQIRGEHVVRIYDVGTLDNGTPFMVMELLEGSDLGSLLHVRGAIPIPVAEMADYVIQTCEALAEAHALGIVHRDLKPQNVFITSRPDGTPLVKLVDFGISKLPESAGGAHEVTTTASLLGTPTYMSPEQLLAPKEVDARSDVWSLGILMYRMLAGKPPFAGETMPELCARILTSPIPRLASSRPDVPEDLARVIRRCLSRQPADRFQSVLELAKALAPFAPLRSQDSVQQIEAIARKSSPAPGNSPNAPSLPLPSDGAVAETTIAEFSANGGASRARAGVVVALMAGAVVVSAIASLVLHRGGTRTSLAAPTTSAPRSVNAIEDAAASAPSSEATTPPVAPSVASATSPDATPAPVRAPAHPSNVPSRRDPRRAAHPADTFPTER
jgi:eukaryotic-like serine/threonine-protein kinase